MAKPHRLHKCKVWFSVFCALMVGISMYECHLKSYGATARMKTLRGLALSLSLLLWNTVHGCACMPGFLTCTSPLCRATIFATLELGLRKHEYRSQSGFLSRRIAGRRDRWVWNELEVHTLIRYWTLRIVNWAASILHRGACLSLASQCLSTEARTSLFCLVLPDGNRQTCRFVLMNLVPIETSSPCESSSYKSSER